MNIMLELSEDAPDWMAGIEIETDGADVRFTITKRNGATYGSSSMSIARLRRLLDLLETT